MRLIVETDLGHDPDDFFAITYLLAAGVQIDAILVAPGDPDQLAIAQFIRDECSPKTLIGSDIGRTKLSSGSIHHALLKRYGRPLIGNADYFGDLVIRKAQVPESEAFIIGPLRNIGRHLKNGGPSFARATMQGGFAPYSLYRPAITLDKFEGQKWVPTFNLNGDVAGAKAFLSAPMPRRMVGKNICHTVEFDKSRLERFSKPNSRAAELFLEAAALYFESHASKKFHDPTAAVLHLHPEVGLWTDGKTTRVEGGWTTYPGEDQVLVDLDYEAMWSRLENWT